MKLAEIKLGRVGRLNNDQLGVDNEFRDRIRRFMFKRECMEEYDRIAKLFGSECTSLVCSDVR